MLKVFPVNSFLVYNVSNCIFLHCCFLQRAQDLANVTSYREWVLLGYLVCPDELLRVTSIDIALVQIFFFLWFLFEILIKKHTVIFHEGWTQIRNYLPLSAVFGLVVWIYVLSCRLLIYLKITSYGVQKASSYIYRLRVYAVFNKCLPPCWISGCAKGKLSCDFIPGWGKLISNCLRQRVLA